MALVVSAPQLLVYRCAICAPERLRELLTLSTPVGFSRSGGCWSWCYATDGRQPALWVRDARLSAEVTPCSAFYEFLHLQRRAA